MFLLRVFLPFVRSVVLLVYCSVISFRVILASIEALVVLCTLIVVFRGYPHIYEAAHLKPTIRPVWPANTQISLYSHPIWQWFSCIACDPDPLPIEKNLIALLLHKHLEIIICSSMLTRKAPSKFCYRRHSKFVVCRLFFIKNKCWHFMWIAGDFDEMPRHISLNNKTQKKCHLFQMWLDFNG